MPFNFFSTLCLTFQHPHLPLFLPPLSVGSSVGEVLLFLLVKSDLLLWGGVLVGCRKQKHGLFIKEVVWRFFLREIFLYEREVKVVFAFNNEEPHRSWL
jgi:hypothetical protein